MNPFSHFGHVFGMRFVTLHDPLALSRTVQPPMIVSTEEDYLVRQLRHWVHELEHVFGAGLGEYHSLAYVPDRTGVPPIQNLSLLAGYPGVTDPFWIQHRACSTTLCSAGSSGIPESGIRRIASSSSTPSTSLRSPGR